MSEQSTGALAARVVEVLAARDLTVATCESITGGLLAGALTAVPGASRVYRGGLITYASDLKVSLAGVDADWVSKAGVVNETTAVQMALGAQQRCGALMALATTGVAGPADQDGERPGTVWLALALNQPGPRDPVLTRRLDLTGDRGQVRDQVVHVALHWLLATLSPVP